MNIVNLTQHAATPDQLAAGVHDLPEMEKAVLAELLTFHSIPSHEEVQRRAKVLASLAKVSGYQTAMIGGAPYLMGPLEAALRARGLTPVYSFSVRSSEEQLQADGTVRKVNVFKHGGFVQTV